MNGTNAQPKIKLAPPTLQPWAPSGDTSRDIAVLMSGGVDSSVTALLLRNAGWNVLGITMKIPVAENCDAKRSCCGLEAGYVARDLGIPHYYVDVRDAFQRLVIDPFRRDYAQGRTPSPCVDCNTLFKFGLVWDFIEREFGIPNLATGHYALVVDEKRDGALFPRKKGSVPFLVRGEDHTRDQSYFLYGIPRERLAQFYLPVGSMSKDEVRKLARKARLPVARRQDSMELCFAAEGDYRAALDAEPVKGPVLDVAGNVIGEHEGIANYTVGQRKGVGIAAGKPIYVIRVSAADNSITVGTREQAENCEVSAEDVNVLIPDRVRAGDRLFGKIRSQGEPSECLLTQTDGHKIGVRFMEPQFAPTPGQRLVLYDCQDRVVAGGTIVLSPGGEG